MTTVYTSMLFLGMTSESVDTVSSFQKDYSC